MRIKSEENIIAYLYSFFFFHIILHMQNDDKSCEDQKALNDIYKRAYVGLIYYLMVF